LLESHFTSVVGSDNTRKSSDSVHNSAGREITNCTTVVLSSDNTLYDFTKPSFLSRPTAALNIIADNTALSLGKPFLPVVKVLLDVVGVIVVGGVAFTTVVMPANREDGCAFTSVFPSEDDCRVFSVRALNLDVMRFFFLDCCQYFFP